MAVMDACADFSETWFVQTVGRPNCHVATRFFYAKIVFTAKHRVKPKNPVLREFARCHALPDSDLDDKLIFDIGAKCKAFWLTNQESFCA